MCYISGLPFLPILEDSLFIAELKILPISSILTLTKVLEYYETMEHCHSKLCTNKIVIILRGDEIEISVVSVQPDGFIMKSGDWSIKTEDSPDFFIQRLEEAKAKERLIDGSPAAIIEFSKDVRDYIFEMANRI